MNRIAILCLVLAAPTGALHAAPALLGIPLTSGEGNPQERVIATASTVTDQTAAYLSSGTPGSLASIDQAEVELRKALEALAASDPASPLPRQIGRALWVRSQLLFSFQNAWKPGATNPRENDAARRHLIEALKITDEISQMTGSRLISVDPNDPSANRARQIATTYGIYLPPGATTFEGALPVAPR